MAAGQTSEVESALKQFCTDNPTVIGYILLNLDGIPVKYHEDMPYDRAVMYAALMTDYLRNCKKSLREFGPDNELQNVRLRTKSMLEIVAIATTEYTLITIQNCSGKSLKEEAAAAPAAEA